MNSRKTVFTLCVNDYAPEITEITFPFLAAYADKIGARFEIITERRWPELPCEMEKLQIFERGRGNDWNIYIDADCLVHPDFFDVTETLPRDTVLQNAHDFALNRYLYDDVFRRDGRHIGCCNWFTVASRWCLDLWAPLNITVAEAVRNIRPIGAESRNGITAPHLLDDYALSRNVARFGLKYKTLKEFLVTLGNGDGEYLWHPFGDLDSMLSRIGVDAADLPATSKKVLLLHHVLKNWKLEVPAVPVAG